MEKLKGLEGLRTEVRGQLWCVLGGWYDQKLLSIPYLAFRTCLCPGLHPEQSTRHRLVKMGG